MNRGMRTSTCLSVVMFAIVLACLPTSAQVSTEMSDCVTEALASGDRVAQINALGRAKNLARQAAEAANGGLGVYRAEAAFHGRVSDAPCVDNGNNTWTFTVKGGAPGFTTPTQETVVTVDGNTWTVKVDYNGAVRS